MPSLLSYVSPAAGRGEAVGKRSALLVFLSLFVLVLVVILVIVLILLVVLVVLLLHGDTSLRGTAYGISLPEKPRLIHFFAFRGFLFAQKGIYCSKERPQRKNLCFFFKKALTNGKVVV